MKREIAIVGGGVIGLICAWRLRQRDCSVALFERGEVGREASWAAAGMIAPLCEAARYPPMGSQGAGAAFFDLCLHSRALYPALAAELLDATGIDIELSIQGAPDTDWRRPGFRYYVTSADDNAAAGFLKLQNRGYAVREHCADNTDGIAARACFELPDEGQVENRILVRALRQAAVASGVEIREDADVTAIRIDDGRATGLTVGDEHIEFDKVLVCAGAWSGTIAGLDVPIRPLRGQMLALRGDDSLRQVVYSSDVYLVPRRDGRILVGATMEETGFDKTTTQSARDELLKKAYRLLPRLAEFPVEAHWSGLRPVSPDHLPVLGPTSFENVYIAAGHYRNGILLAPATGELMMESILDDSPIPQMFGIERYTKSRA